MNYGTKLKDLRELRNLTQKDIAKILDIDSTQYCHYENETRTIPIRHLNTLANYFKVSLDYLFGLSIKPTYEDMQPDFDLNKTKVRLKELRKRNNLTQDKLADILKIDRSVLSKFERGIYPISTPFLYTICKKYRASADYLLGRIDEPKNR